ncbi:hypothetical protein CCACVL1_04429 [Corchorus capsularis]|uniref:DUF8040 domain-containing protein n=1 Tax=Corchorus capsularis TaxID=210143 RepID=A0A1R3JSI3_COCAP|nr:hypothetical protein CCACVL1_04429 [Corchorus capsularis]
MVFDNDIQAVDNIKMDRRAFAKLCHLLQTVGKLKDSRNSTVEELVISFLHIAAHNVKNRILKRQIGRFGKTVSRQFHAVLNAILRLHSLCLKKPEPIPENHTDERWKWFKGVYNPKMQFNYVLPGWEGSAIDGRVLRDVISRKNGLKVPQGFVKVWLTSLLSGFENPWWGIQVLEIKDGELHLCIDYEMWENIQKGPWKPTKSVEREFVEKPRVEWTQEDIKKYQLNFKAINRVSTCTIAKEIWEKLRITHEEIVTSLIDRFSSITNQLNNLGKDIPEGERVKKLLRALPKSWNPLTTAIREARDLNETSFDEICGSLLTHEVDLRSCEEDEKKRAAEKKRCLALKVSALEEEIDSLTIDETGSEPDEETEIQERGRNYLYKKNFKKDKFKAKSWQSNVEEDIKANLCLTAKEDEPEVEHEHNEEGLKAQSQEKKPCAPRKVVQDDDDVGINETNMKDAMITADTNEIATEEINEEPLIESIFINQSKYTKEMLKKFGMEDCKPMKTPMATGTKLDSDEKGKVVDQKLYRGMIGSLLYLTASRPDILFSVCLCDHFQSRPNESHLIAVKKIFRYLHGTTGLGLWYPKGSLLDLAGYFDVNFVGSKTNRKSTNGTCQFLGQMLVSWSSKKQNSVALSTAEAEYIAAGS